MDNWGMELSCMIGRSNSWCSMARRQNRIPEATSLDRNTDKRSHMMNPDRKDELSAIHLVKNKCNPHLLALCDGWLVYS
jgi:hypothetical protein